MGQSTVKFEKISGLDVALGMILVKRTLRGDERRWKIEEKTMVMFEIEAPLMK